MLVGPSTKAVDPFTSSVRLSRVTIEWSTDVGQADWWVSGLHDFAQDVGALVTDAFPAIARVFHAVPDDGSTMRWQDIAHANGRIAHAGMQFDALMHGSNALGGPDRPDVGSLPADTLSALVEVLEVYTTTPEQAWFAVWHGFGQLDGSAVAMTWSSAGEPLTVPVASIVPAPFSPGRVWWLPGVSICC